jgi:hypothetical protein
VTMQLLIRDTCPMIAAPVQGDVDGITKGTHGVVLVLTWERGRTWARTRAARPLS